MIFMRLPYGSLKALQLEDIAQEKKRRPAGRLILILSIAVPAECQTSVFRLENLAAPVGAGLQIDVVGPAQLARAFPPRSADAAP